MREFLQRIGRSSPASPTEIEVADAHRRQSAGALLIDVRERDEWNAGHPVGARHIPLGVLETHLRNLPRDREILFICRTGRRSGIATAAAHHAGLTNARNVRGGILAWIQAGLPVASGG